MVSGNIAEKQFKKMKKFSYEKSSVTLWIVFRSLRQKIAKYSVRNVKIDDSLEYKLTGILSTKIKNSNEFTEYDFISIDHDEKLLTLDSSETDFEDIVGQINLGADSNPVKTNEDLSRAWAYIIKIENDDDFMLGFKKIEENWDVKKRSTKINMLFKEQKFIDLLEDDVFKIEKVIDFIYFGKILFVINKIKFELGLNFREGMKAKRDDLLDEFKSLSIVSNIKKIKDKVGDNMHYLRQLSTINKNGYFRHPGFMEKLSRVNDSEKWGLSIINNEIQIDDDNIEVVLKVLNKDRLKDLIEGETFDVAVKKSVVVS